MMGQFYETDNGKLYYISEEEETLGDVFEIDFDNVEEKIEIIKEGLREEVLNEIKEMGDFYIQEQGKIKDLKLEVENFAKKHNVNNISEDMNSNKSKQEKRKKFLKILESKMRK